ncbi:hypothetical protein, partial [Vibrio parahaemolyticus]
KMITAISSLSIYLPDEFRSVLYTMRKVVSCSARDSETIANTLRSFGADKTIPPLAQGLYKDLTDCFHAMCAKYLGISDNDKSYSDLLSKYNLDSEAKTTKTDPENTLAYKFLLLPEYYGSGEHLDAQDSVEQLYKNCA